MNIHHIRCDEVMILIFARAMGVFILTYTANVPMLIA
jgi:hypothetical protein